jgi:hypothetical protein
MNSGHRRGYVAFTVAATLIVASILFYRIRPLAGIALGSGATALVVLAHLGVLGALVGPLVARRRARRYPPSQQDRRK